MLLECSREGAQHAKVATDGLLHTAAHVLHLQVTACIIRAEKYVITAEE